MKIINKINPDVEKIKSEIDLASFVIYTNVTQAINEDETNPSVFTDMLEGPCNKIKLFDTNDGSVINTSNETINYLEGTLNFQPNKSGGGTSRLHLVSERSIDGGNTWIGNYNSLRSIEVSNSGETFKTVISVLNDFLPSEICRFRIFNDAGGSMVLESPIDTILGEEYTGPSVLWTMQQRIKV